MKRIIIFTMKGCPFCENLKKRLTGASIRFIEMDIDEYSDIWKELVKEIQHEYLPTTIITDDEIDEGYVFVPTIDYQTEDEIFEIIKSHV